MAREKWGRNGSGRSADAKQSEEENCFVVVAVIPAGRRARVCKANCSRLLEARWRSSENDEMKKLGQRAFATTWLAQLAVPEIVLVVTVASLAFAIVAWSPSSWAQAQKKSLEAQAAQFENRICGVNPNRTLFRNPKNEETVLFFQNHTPKVAFSISDFLPTFKKKSERAAHVKEFINSNYSIARKLDEIVATIGDRLIAKKLAWLGIEKTSDDMAQPGWKDLFKNATAVEAQIKNDKMSATEIKLYLQLQLGPIMYSLWKNEQLRKAARLFPLDDMAMRMRSAAYKESTDQKATALLEAVPNSGIRTSDMEQIIDMSQVSLFSGVKERTPEFLALTAKIKKPAVKKLVEEYRKWIEQGVDSLAERDEAVTKIILSQKGMGLIVLSANFGPGVAERLMEACPNQMKKTSPTKTHTAAPAKTL